MSDFPSLSSLLIQGNDHRLLLDEQGHNAYYCRPYPHLKLLRLGSSTASTISDQQWKYAQTWHANMEQEVRKSSIEHVKEAHTQAIIQELRQACQLPEHTSIQLADSGTDAHRLAMQHFCQKKPGTAWHVVMVDAAETGRGVPKALCLADSNITYENIAIRQISGELLPPNQIEQAVQKSVKSGIQQGLDIVLLMVDVSKTGCIAPSLEAMLQLRQQDAQRIHILLDACQFRFSVETLNHYLQYDFVIAITGSKFLAAPSFCAALLIPHQTQHVQNPQDMGLLLRWRLALQNLHALHALSTHDCASFMEASTKKIQAELQHQSAFLPLPTSFIQRAKVTQKHWQDYPSIFPFFITTGKRLISYREALIIFQDLQCDVQHPVQMGRPMPFTMDLEREPLGIFRIGISAPLIIDAIQKGQYKDKIQQTIHAFQQLKKIVETRDFG